MNVPAGRLKWTTTLNSIKAGVFRSVAITPAKARYRLAPATAAVAAGGGFGGGEYGGRGGFGGGQPTTTQGYINANYGVDMGLRKDFQIKKNTATVSAELAGCIQDPQVLCTFRSNSVLYRTTGAEETRRWFA